MTDVLELEYMAQFFKVLGDPTRLRIMEYLMTGESSVGDIAQSLNMSHSSISHQLKLLKLAKLVKYRREGKQMIYSLDDSHVSEIINLALEHLRE